MQVFQIKGLSGLLMFILAVAGLLALFLLLPGAFMMVFWNAVVFEGFYGPEIGLIQGLLLWGVALLFIKLVMNPQISFQFRKVSDPKDIDKHLGE
jgi:hypothetical protein